MKITTRICISTDGYVTTPDGWPVQLADPTFKPGQSHAFPEFLDGVEQALMGATTFAPAAGRERSPWEGLGVFVLGSERPEGTSDDVTYDSDPERLLEQLRASNRGGDVHLVGGPKTVETFRRLGALDELGLIVLPILVGDGLRLTPAISPDAGLTLLRSRTLPEGAVENIYAVSAD